MPSKKSKRTLAQEGSSDRDSPSKRSRTHPTSTSPVVTKGTSRIDTPLELTPQQTIQAGGPASGVKFEGLSDDMLAKALRKRRKDLTPKDLPSKYMHAFYRTFRPAIRDFVATLDPWESPADEDVIRIWNSCFPRHELQDSENLQDIIVKLGLKSWRKDIATTAVQSLKTTLGNYSDKSSVRVARAAWLLGDDEKDRKRPFYYKNYGNGSQPSGIFQSPIVAATLAAHLSSISYLPDESRLQNYPAGALALSVLAVKRALTWAKTGINTIPNTTEGHFSRANWGDHYKLQGGRWVLTRTASNIVVVINKLRDVQWERILAEAGKYAIERNTTATLKSCLEGDETDFELEDWDDDFE